MKTQHIWNSWHFEVWNRGKIWISNCVGIGLFNSKSKRHAIILMREKIETLAPIVS